ncbi:hypothetical protein BJ165DRAFT_1546847, partial [Panaeolus papilionaceus]
MEAFFSTLLRYIPGQERSTSGILGHTSAYYGCVEAQGRGSLHCHLLVWLENSINPDDLRQRLLQDSGFQTEFIDYLRKVIHTEIPEDPLHGAETLYSTEHPCKLRGPFVSSDHNDIQIREHDLHFLSESCQRHTHSATCYKYWKGPGYEKKCRFDLNASNVSPNTSVDAESGEIEFENKDGLVNNFCKPMLEAIRCNMDIKFIGSGTASKAILYYITDYITKSPLKAHVSYAALESAINRLGAYDPEVQDFHTYIKSVIHKCAFGMISRQELSGQEVCCYLRGSAGCKCSHKFRSFF